MMRPHLFLSIDGKASRVVWNAEDRLMARIASHFSGGKSCNAATCWIPALLTRMSSRPDDCSVLSIISRMACGFDISADEYDTRTLKSAAIFACACATSSGLPNPLRTMSEPAAASARAMPSPIPLVEPVTSDSLPASVGPAATFSGLMATFMAPQPSGWDDDDLPRCCAVICRTGATQRQCRLANGLIKFRYGQAGVGAVDRRGNVRARQLSPAPASPPATHLRCVCPADRCPSLSIAGSRAPPRTASFNFVASCFPIVTIWETNQSEHQDGRVDRWSVERALVARPFLEVEVRRLPPDGVTGKCLIRPSSSPRWTA